MQALPGIDRIYLVNVRSFVERREFVLAQLRRFGLDAELVHDWDASDITPEVRDQHFEGSELSLGQMSCALKHREALRRIVERGQRALVLEDDVILAPEFAAGVASALRESPRYPVPQVIFMGCGGNWYTPRSQRRPGVHLYPASRGRFADSYIIDAEAARRRLEWMDTHRMPKPIDNMFDVMDPQIGVQILWFEDPVVEQGSKSGIFTTALEQAPPNWLQGLKFRLEKLRRKYLYQLWK